MMNLVQDLESAIAISEGAEASAPFHPDQKPIDAYNAAILDVDRRRLTFLETGRTRT